MPYTTAEFESIYKRCFPKAIALAKCLLYDEEEARDVAQQALIALWETPTDVANPDAFVTRSVRNACLNRIRSLSTRDRVKNLYAIELENYDDDIDLQVSQVRDAFDLLSERERQVVEQVFTEGNTYRETASHLDISISTVNKHIVNALKTLRNHFNSSKK